LQAFEQLYNQDKRFLLRVAFGNLPNDWSHERCEVIIPNNDIELARYYKSLDILIAPGTVQHGAPHYPVLEAMACAIPVVTTGYYGADDSTAWIVKNRSFESIVSAVKNIINNSELTYSKSLKALQIAQQLDWEIVSKKMIDCFGPSSSER
jgi:glycosyltransferase involved in cell wall biosynthesis